jgi:hypothetical protein
MVKSASSMFLLVLLSDVYADGASSGMSRLEEKDVTRPVTTEEEAFHLDRFDPEIPRDGIPVLYNSH